MTIKERINNDFTSAYKEKNMEKKSILSVVKSEVSRAEAGKLVLDDAGMVKLIRKMIENAKLINTDESKYEITVLNEYVPAMLTEEALTTAINSIITDLTMSGVITSDKPAPFKLGMCMKELAAKYNGLYETMIAAKIINNLLK